MFGLPFARNNVAAYLPPSQFRDLARNVIYQQLPPLVVTSTSASSVRSAPSQYQQYKLLNPHLLHRLTASSVFLAGKRLVRSAPSIYSSSTATIPEDLEPVATTVEQLLNDVVLHESYSLEQHRQKVQQGMVVDNDALDDDELYKISLGLELQYQNVPESLVDWNLNVTRCKLIITQLPIVSSTPDLTYLSNSLPQLIGDLAQMCHIVLIQPHITDKELIYTLFLSNIYQEHNLDYAFKKLVAEISVKQLRLLQINLPRKSRHSLPITLADQTFLRFKFKEIAIRNYLINLAAAATTAYEYKVKTDSIKRSLKQSQPGEPKKKLSKDEKKRLWEQVRLDVFKRAGLEE